MQTNGIISHHKQDNKLEFGIVWSGENLGLFGGEFGIMNDNFWQYKEHIHHLLFFIHHLLSNRTPIA